MTNHPFVLNAGQRKQQQFIPPQWNHGGGQNFASWTFKMKEDYMYPWPATLRLASGSTVAMRQSQRPF